MSESKSILEATAPASNGQHIAAVPDPFNPERLRLSQDFGASLGVKKALLTIPVRKPSKELFVRCHASESYRVQTGVIELKEDDRDVYLCDPGLWPELATTESLFGPRLLITSISRQGNVFLWPLKLPGADGRTNSWNQSAIEAADLATKSWVRIAPNMGLGGYDCYQSTASLPEPVWPDLPFGELLRIAFKGKLIDSLDHPVLSRLRGEA
jgi:hypothetical protein